eukprot:Pompholyxophrys_punicea_v1_NODE_476_length_1875_cov_10.178571.p1 type:complete len:277 gc:universal NODE_476_length_1875_cov_10.178571:351-1181(+)
MFEMLEINNEESLAPPTEAELDQPGEGVQDMFEPSAIIDENKMNLREKIFETMENPEFSKLAACLNIFLLTVIVFSTLSLILSTVPALNESVRQKNAWFGIEVFVVVVFTIEYLIRLFTCPVWYKWIIQPMSIIDLVSILPFYIEQILKASVPREDAASLSAFAVLRVLRLVRVLRMFKLGKTSKQIGLFTRALKRSQEGIVMLLFLLTLAVIFFATCMYYAETIYCTLDTSVTPPVWRYIPSLDPQESESSFGSILDSMVVFFFCLCVLRILFGL